MKTWSIAGIFQKMAVSNLSECAPDSLLYLLLLFLSLNLSTLISIQKMILQLSSVAERIWKYIYIMPIWNMMPLLWWNLWGKISPSPLRYFVQFCCATWRIRQPSNERRKNEIGLQHNSQWIIQNLSFFVRINFVDDGDGENSVNDEWIYEFMFRSASWHCRPRSFHKICSNSGAISVFCILFDNEYARLNDPNKHSSTLLRLLPEIQLCIIDRYHKHSVQGKWHLYSHPLHI